MTNQYQFTAAQRQKALLWLSFWHITIIAASNFLVQFPVEVFGLQTTWGTFTFPFIFLTTDLTVRIFGAHLARKIIFFVMFPALIISYVVSVLFQNGNFTDLSSLTTLNTFVARIAIASFAAYIVGQLLDIGVFNRLRQNRRWWVAPTASTVIGNAVDTAVFYLIAFYQSSDVFMAANWVEIGVVDYMWKLIISALFFLPAYGLLLRYLTRRLTALEASGVKQSLATQS